MDSVDSSEGIQPVLAHQVPRYLRLAASVNAAHLLEFEVDFLFSFFSLLLKLCLECLHSVFILVRHFPVRFFRFLLLFRKIAKKISHQV